MKSLFLVLVLLIIHSPLIAAENVPCERLVVEQALIDNGAYEGPNAYLHYDIHSSAQYRDGKALTYAITFNYTDDDGFSGVIRSRYEIKTLGRSGAVWVCGLNASPMQTSVSYE